MALDKPESRGTGSTATSLKADRVPSVFISYRKDDARRTAAAMAEHLKDDLTTECVFRDEDDLIGGQEWKTVLESALSHADAALVLVGADWAGGAEPGSRRIDEQDDMVRREVQLALGESTKVYPVPVLLDGAEPASELPDDISDLFKPLHRVEVSRADLESGQAEGYQKVLVSVWEALRARVPNGFLVIGSEGDRTALDDFVKKLNNEKLIDEVRSLSRCFAGAYILSRRETKKALKETPDAIILVDEDADDDYLMRVAAYVGLKSTRDVRLVGGGAAAALSLVEVATGGAASKAAISTASEAVGSVAGSAQSGIGAVWAGMGVGAKVASAAAATALVFGSAVAVLAIIDQGDTVSAQFPDETVLDPTRPERVDAYPLGSPDSMQVELGTPVALDAAAANDYFRNFEGGEVEERTMSVQYEGNTFDLGTVVVPVVFPKELVENNTGTFVLTEAGLDETSFVEAGTGAFSPCSYRGTGDTVGGWVYTGDPGSLQVALFFTSDGDDVTDLGVRATFEGPATVELDEELIAEVVPPEVNINDQCTPQESAASFWDSGTTG